MIRDLEKKLEINPNDDEAYANWGTLLLNLSYLSEDQDQKREYVTQCIEKIEKAINLNEDCKSSEGALAIFGLGNALFFKFFLEKDDAEADRYLERAKKNFEIAVEKDKDNLTYASMIPQISTAHEQRKATLEQLRRLEGMSEDEKQSEMKLMKEQMVENVVTNCRSRLEQDPYSVEARCCILLIKSLQKKIHT